MLGMDLTHGNKSTEDDSAELDYEISEALSDQEGLEGLENVCAYYGRRTVGQASGLHDLAHTHEHHTLSYDQPQPTSRPSSPAFSFLSKASSREIR